MQEYFEQFPQENGSIFLFNAYTGEAIYDVDRWGSPLPDAHKLSHWFEPTAMVPPLNIEDSSSGRVHISDVSFVRAEAELDGTVRVVYVAISLEIKSSHPVAHNSGEKQLITVRHLLPPTPAT